MVCFIILHYMALDETVLCVNSILNNVRGKKKIVIVDNASPNGSAEGLKKEYENNNLIDIIEMSSNLGFAKGNNLGYFYAVQHYAPEYIVVMNNDMEIKQEDFIDQIYDSYEKYNYAILGPDIYSTKKKYHQNPQTRKMPTRDDLLKSYRSLVIKDKAKFLIYIKWMIKNISGKTSTTEDRSNIPYVDHVVENQLLHGSCYIFSRIFIDKHPMECFYNKTFMYLEAEILYYLAIKKNEKIIYYPGLKVDHHEDVATDAKFKTQYKKSVFSVKCLLQSTKAFLELMDSLEG